MPQPRFILSLCVKNSRQAAMRASVSFLLLLLLAVGAARADFVTDINCFNSEYGCGDQGSPGG